MALLLLAWSMRLFGPGWCFTMNGISFIAVISALLMIRLKAAAPSKATGTALDDLKEGLRYVVSHPTIRMLIAVVMVTMVFGMSFVTLMPAWTVKVLGGDSTTNGFLYSARGVGSLSGRPHDCVVRPGKDQRKAADAGEPRLSGVVAGLVDRTMAPAIIADARRRRVGLDACAKYVQYPRAVPCARPVKRAGDEHPCHQRIRHVSDRLSAVRELGTEDR